MDRPEPLTNFWCEVLDFPARGDAFITAVTEKIREDLSELLVEGRCV